MREVFPLSGVGGWLDRLLLTAVVCVGVWNDTQMPSVAGSLTVSSHLDTATTMNTRSDPFHPTSLRGVHFTSPTHSLGMDGRPRTITYQVQSGVPMRIMCHVPTH